MAKKIIYQDNTHRAGWSGPEEALFINIPPKTPNADKMIEAIKEIPGMYWHSKRKKWYIPIEQYKAFIEIIQTYQISCKDERVIDKIKEYKRTDD